MSVPAHRGPQRPPNAGKGEPMPPHNADAEEVVVGACLAYPPTWLSLIAAIIQPSHFFEDRNGLVFEAVLGCYQRDGVDGVTDILVTEELDRMGILAAVGGPGRIDELIGALPLDTRGIEPMARVIREDAIKRDIMAFGRELVDLGARADQEPTAILNRAITRLGAISVSNQPADAGWIHLGEKIDRDVSPEFNQLLTPPSPDAESPEPGPGAAIPTGLPSLDRWLTHGGLLPGMLYVVGGPTSSGKSTLMRWILHDIAARGHTVALVTPEQNAHFVGRELIDGLSRFDRVAKQQGQPISQDERYAIYNAIDAVRPLPFYVDEQIGETPRQILAQLTGLRARYPELAVVAIDYLHILGRGDLPRSQNDEQQLTEMVVAIRDGCKKLGVACLLGSQLSNAASDKRQNHDLRPKLWHFRGSGSIAFLAYSVWSLYREDYYAEQGLLDVPPERWTSDEHGSRIYRSTNDLEITILKQQGGAANVTATVKFHRNTRTIIDPFSPPKPAPGKDA